MGESTRVESWREHRALDEMFHKEIKYLRDPGPGDTRERQRAYNKFVTVIYPT